MVATATVTLVGLAPSSAAGEGGPTNYVQQWEVIVDQVSYANGLAAHPTETLLYLSLTSGHQTHPNAILEYNYGTGARRYSAHVGSEPGPLAVSPDGASLYVGLTGANRIARLTTVDLGVVYDVAVGAVPTDIAIDPGDSGRVIVGTKDRDTVLVTGTEVAANVAVCCTQVAFADDGRAIGRSRDFVYTLTFDTDGLYVDEIADIASGGSGYDLWYHDGMVISSGGEVIDPDTLAEVRNISPVAALSPDLDRGFVCYEPAATTRCSEVVISTGESLAERLIPEAVISSSFHHVSLGTDGIATLSDHPSTTQGLVILSGVPTSKLTVTVRNVLDNVAYAQPVEVYDVDFRKVRTLEFPPFETGLPAGTYYVLARGLDYAMWYPGVGEYRPEYAAPIVLTGDDVAIDTYILEPLRDVFANPDIDFLVNAAISYGCNYRTFCPEDAVTRGQMASFLARALDLPTSPTDYFTDDTTSTHQTAINALRHANITLGCTTDGTTYCPDNTVTRGQMASFLARALDLPTSPTDYFTDDTTSTHQTAINALRHANITLGCTTDGTTYCPDDTVIRRHMAAFLHRALADRYGPLP